VIIDRTIDNDVVIIVVFYKLARRGSSFRTGGSRPVLMISRHECVRQAVIGL